MEWNPKTPSLWDWDSLALFGGGGGGGDNGSVYSSELGNGSSSRSSISASVDSSAKAGKEAAAEASAPKNLDKSNDSAGRSSLAAATAVGPAGCQEALIGLKLGKRTYFEDACTGSSAKNPPSSSSSASAVAPVKKPKVSPPSARSTHCQVEGCDDDLRAAKEYHRKHRVCENHSKSPRVVVNGHERRFCQQCSRFHDLSEFDQKKRSCRRRLSDHNARRRKPQPDAISFNPARLSSSYYDCRQNLLRNKDLFGHMRPMASAWEGSCDFRLAPLKGSWMKSTKSGAIDGQLHLANSEQSNAFSTVCHEANRLLPLKDTTAEVLDRGLEASVTASNLDGAPDLRRALSLLSTNSWSSADPGPTSSSLVRLVHVNHTSVAQPTSSATISTSDYWQGEQPLAQQVRGLPFGMHGNGSQFQEYQLLRAPYETTFLDTSQIH